MFQISRELAPLKCHSSEEYYVFQKSLLASALKGHCLLGVCDGCSLGSMNLIVGVADSHGGCQC